MYAVMDASGQVGSVVAQELLDAGAAVRACGVPAIVVLSSIGAHLESASGVAVADHTLEAVLRDAAQSVTMVRVAWFLEEWAGSLSELRKWSEERQAYAAFFELLVHSLRVHDRHLRDRAVERREHAGQTPCASVRGSS